MENTAGGIPGIPIIPLVVIDVREKYIILFKCERC